MVEYVHNDGRHDYENVEAESLDTESQDTTEAAIGQLEYQTGEYNPHPITQPISPTPATWGPARNVNNPVVDGSEVTDMTDAAAVADPQLIYEPDDGGSEGPYFLFCEVIDSNGSNQGVVYYQADDLSDLSNGYGSHVLNADTAYPDLTKWNGTYYSAQNIGGTNGFQVYEVTDFPATWSKASDEMTGVSDPQDPKLFRWPATTDETGRWWIFYRHGSNSQTRLAYSEQTDGPPTGLSWTQHPNNDLTASNKFQKPAGPVYPRQDAIQLFFQGVGQDEVRTRFLTSLTTTDWTLAAEPSIGPIVESHHDGEWWDQGVHSLGVLPGLPNHPTVAAIDGKSSSSLADYAIGIYQAGVPQPQGFDIYQASATSQTLSGGSITTLTFDSVDHDIGSHLRSGNDGWVAPKEGRYSFTLGVHLDDSTWSSSDTPFRVQIRIRNGTTGETFAVTNPHVGVAARSGWTLSATDVWMDEGDYVEADVYQDYAGDGTGDVDILGGQQFTFLQGRPDGQ